MAAPAPRPRLALFDLDHTLLDGDSDVLWCDFLMARGVLDRAVFEPRNAAMERDYRAGSVSAADFSAFYVSTLAGRTPADWSVLRQDFLDHEVLPRIGDDARALLARHRARDDLLVLTTATNRFLTELTARVLGFEHLLATECEQDAAGRFTGRPAGVLNMREGKVTRLHAWLAARGESLPDFHSSFHSDSINDLPLLSEVDEPVVVDADARLAAVATERGWPALRLYRG